MRYVLCLHRWVGNQALYDDYELSDDLAIRAICTSEALASLPKKRMLSSKVLPSLDDSTAVISAAEALINEHGVPSLVIALNEGDLFTAALIRECWGIPGDACSLIEQFRDKLKMLDVASRQKAIQVLPAKALEEIDELIEEYGFPLVLKPRQGTASRGVKILYSPEQLETIKWPHAEPMMVQVYCDAPILHVDGWWDGEKIVVATASRYTNTCADFGSEVPLASIELPEGEGEKRIVENIKQLLHVFSPDKELVFHLELFDKGDKLVFLEIGARVGGAEIPYIWREVRNIDLLGIAWELQTGASTRVRDSARQLSYDSRPRDNTRGAWVIAQSDNTLNEDLLTLYWSQHRNLKRYASGIYEGAKVRLRFCSSEHELLERDVNQVVAQLTEL